MELNITGIPPFCIQNRVSIGTRSVEHGGKILITTGPERTLVEGFRKPALVGGLEELVNSAGGFPVPDLSLLEHILDRFGTARRTAICREEVLGGEVL